MQLIIKIIIQQANQSQLFYIKQRKEKQNKTNKNQNKSTKLISFMELSLESPRVPFWLSLFFLQNVKASEDPAFLK